MPGPASEGRTMLVIGAGGFLGRHVCEAAADAGLQVVAAGRARCDLLDPASVAACLEAAEPDLVANMAGAASVADSWERPEETFEVNAGGVATLLDAVAERVPSAHVLCVSSAEVYGDPAGRSPPFAEETPPQPLTPYGRSKAAMEAECDRRGGEAGLRIAVVRAFNQLGPGQPAAFAASGFARQIAAAELAGAERVELGVGNLGAARDFTDVRDAARGFVAVSREGLTGVYNLCSGRALRLETLVAEMREATPLPLEIVPDPSRARPADPGVVYGDPRRLRDETGWTPQIPLSESVADLLDWWRAELAGS